MQQFGGSDALPKGSDSLFPSTTTLILHSLCAGWYSVDLFLHGADKRAFKQQALQPFSLSLFLSLVALCLALFLSLLQPAKRLEVWELQRVWGSGLMARGSDDLPVQ